MNKLKTLNEKQHEQLFSEVKKNNNLLENMSVK